MENEKRDLKWALEEAISALTVMDAQYNGKYGDVYKQAADMLRNGGSVVEQRERLKLKRCNACGANNKCEYEFCLGCGAKIDDPKNRNIVIEKRWTEREKIQIVPEKSEPTFEEITHE